MSRRSQGLLVAVLWVVSILLLFVAVTRYDTMRLAHAGFPRMPLYGAITWWFFFTIPVIGITWGFFNDWKGDRR
ncbi:MAG TPA: hypothetical protein VJ812_05360 [Gemmatimonadaceae bacterium]|jgi:hypothetical protein|nr:hypothetical protein [Gemmatimonadaceae bacterium]